MPESSSPAEPAAQPLLRQLKSMLVDGESLLEYAAQHRLFALAHRRVVLAATSGRLIGIERSLISGFEPVDIRWQDIKSVHISAGVFGSTLTITALDQPDLPSNATVRTVKFSGLCKDEAQAVYRICQAQEQAWREKRRLRELEELRARSGGFQAHTAGDRLIGDTATRLQAARDMLDKGLVSDAEFETLKAKIIGSI